MGVLEKEGGVRETTEKEDFSKIPHWKCWNCGTRDKGPGLDLETQVCGCGKGAGTWGVENGHLIKANAEVLE